MHDILEDATTDELEVLKFAYADIEDQGCGNHVHTINELALLSSMVVTDKVIKWFINWLNARTKGTIIDFGAKHTSAAHPKQINALQRMRKCYFPNLHFDHCQVFRGVVTPQLSVLQKGGDHAVVIMWKKHDSKKRLYAATIETFDLIVLIRYSGLL